MGGTRSTRARTELVDRARRSSGDRAARNRSLLLRPIRRGLASAGYAVVSELAHDDRVRLEFDGPARGFVEVEAGVGTAPRISDTSVLTEPDGVPAVSTSGWPVPRFLTLLLAGARDEDFLTNAELARFVELRDRTPAAVFDSVRDSVTSAAGWGYSVYNDPFLLLPGFYDSLYRGRTLAADEVRRVTATLASLADGAPLEWLLRHARVESPSW